MDYDYSYIVCYAVSLNPLRRVEHCFRNTVLVVLPCGHQPAHHVDHMLLTRDGAGGQLGNARENQIPPLTCARMLRSALANACKSTTANGYYILWRHQITNTSRTLYFISFTTPLDQLTQSEYGSSMNEKECS